MRLAVRAWGAMGLGQIIRRAVVGLGPLLEPAEVGAAVIFQYLEMRVVLTD